MMQLSPDGAKMKMMMTAQTNPKRDANTQGSSYPAIFDRLLVLIALPTMLPLLALIALAIRLTSKGPAILTRTCWTATGRSYREYRFRCVHMDATQRLWAAQVNGQTAGRDPRLTAVGEVLMLSGLNQLPRLLNVLKGDIRLIRNNFN